MGPKDFQSTFTFNNGRSVKNRLMLAPMTNTQSYPDGRLSDVELRWLESRAQGGFGTLITAASHVQKEGQSFPGQLGSFSDDHIEGLQAIGVLAKRYNTLGILQLVHGGARTPSSLTGVRPAAPSEIVLNFPGYEVPHALEEAEIETIIANFVAAAVRAYKAGLDGIEIHGANGYLFTQFFSSVTNQRTDKWGGSSANRARFLLEVVTRIRKVVPHDFILGVRLLAEDNATQRGFDIDDTLEIIGWLNKHDITYVHLSSGSVKTTAWKYTDSSVTNVKRFREALRQDIALVAAGSVMTGADAVFALDQGADFVAIGKAAIATPDWPVKVVSHDFVPPVFPLTAQKLNEAGISNTFIDYLRVHRLVKESV